MTEKEISEQPVGPEDEFWKRAASFNLKPGNIRIPPEIINSGPEDIDNFLSRVMQTKMNLPCKVTGKIIFISLPSRNGT